MNKLLRQIRLILGRLNIQQKIALAAVTALTIVSLFWLMIWANQPEYGLLYANIDPGDAAEIVQDLKSANIPYELQDGGTTILVPAKDIYELRLKYAGQNLISSGTVGYEVFDRNNFGLTDFLQKVNLKRALEGELSKTINQIEGIQQARVHLVIPEQTLFEEQENSPSASVIFKLRPNFMLDQKQIVGITHMVAGSVEGLNPEKVTILDTNGNILTDLVKGGSDIGLSNSQFELKQKVEKYLSNKAQSMLNRVLGNGNAIVKVSAELNFTKVRRTSERFDPDNTAILSEERNEERSTQNNNVVQQRENVISNYEINKTIEEFEGSTGDIERLSVAVFLNQDEQAQGEAFDEARIAEIVKTAVGFQPERNDKIVVQRMAFDRSTLENEKEEMAAFEQRQFIMELVRIGLIAVGAIILLLALRSFFKKVGAQDLLKAPQSLTPPKPDYESELSIEGVDLEDIYARKLSPAARAKLQEQEKITSEVKDFTEKDPEQATSLLRYWMLEEQ